jgi:hypothetical protein
MSELMIVQAVNNAYDSEQLKITFNQIKAVVNHQLKNKSIEIDYMYFKTITSNTAELYVVYFDGDGLHWHNTITFMIQWCGIKYSIDNPEQERINDIALQLYKLTCANSYYVYVRLDP